MHMSHMEPARVERLGQPGTGGHALRRGPDQRNCWRDFRRDAAWGSTNQPPGHSGGCSSYH